MLLAHNTLRAHHNATGLVKSLAWEDDLAATAADWANTCPNSRAVQPELPNSTARYGQNVAHGMPRAEAYGGLDPNSEPFYAAIEEAMATSRWAVALWYSTGDMYNYTTLAGSTTDWGQFTQVVWASSTALGCAIRDHCDEEGHVVVCNYKPAANVDIPRSLPYNVLQPLPPGFSR